MPALHTEPGSVELAASQKRFVEALLYPQSPVPVEVAGASEAQRVKRFAVYRNNVHASLATAVTAKFPVIERLVGAEFLRATALAFIEQHPPTSPVLSEYGGVFADFLEGFGPAQEFPYLADVARLEWARTVAYQAADADAIAISTLAEVPPDALIDVRLKLHPAVALIASPYPIVSIWRTNTHDEVATPIGPGLGGEVALITRPYLDVLVTELPSSSATFVEVLISGGSFGDAAHAASTADDTFDLPAALAAAFSSGAIAGLEASSSFRSAP